MAKRKTTNGNGNGKNGANLVFEDKLWAAADKMRGHMDASEYKHVALGLISLNYISDAFEEIHALLLRDEGDYEGADPVDHNEYRADNTFFVPLFSADSISPITSRFYWKTKIVSAVIWIRR